MVVMMVVMGIVVVGKVILVELLREKFRLEDRALLRPLLEVFRLVELSAGVWELC
jgi:hypothetical protein